MKRLLPIAFAGLALLGAASFTILPASSQTPSESPSPSPSVPPEASLTPSPSPSPSPSPPPSPSPSPSAAPAGTLRSGVWVRITGTDSCLNARTVPGLTAPGPDGTDQPVAVLNCLPDGFIGKLTDQRAWIGSQEVSPPVEKDGHRWWYILGQGWMAEDWLVFYHEDALPFPPRPDLASAGLIAFTRTDGIWLINADGSGEHQLVAIDQGSASVSGVRWSPDGTALVYSVNVWQTGQQTTRVVDLTGTVLAEYPDIVEAAWSPAGRYLSGLRVQQPGQLGGYRAEPVVIDVTTGAQTVMGPASFQFAAPVWSPSGDAIAFLCFSDRYTEPPPQGTLVVECGGDGLHISYLSGERRVIPLDGANTYFGNPSWSPTGGIIALYTNGLGAPCRGYALLDVASGLIVDCVLLPENGYSGGSCGVGPESGSTDWTVDGGSLIYHWRTTPASGENGIAIVDVATGERRMVPMTNAYSVDPAPDGRHLVLGGESHVWVAAIDGAELTLLTVGDGPAWQPLP